MNPIDKKAYAYGLVAAAVAIVLPYMVQAALTATQLAANAA
jgi:hypothetical protein